MNVRQVVIVNTVIFLGLSFYGDCSGAIRVFNGLDKAILLQGIEEPSLADGVVIKESYEITIEIFDEKNSKISWIITYDNFRPDAIYTLFRGTSEKKGPLLKLVSNFDECGSRHILATSLEKLRKGMQTTKNYIESPKINQEVRDAFIDVYGLGNARDASSDVQTTSSSLETSCEDWDAMVVAKQTSRISPIESSPEESDGMLD